MAKKAWSMRPYRVGDEEQIRPLFKLVFGQPLAADRWRWQYGDNPTGRVTITIAEGEDGTLAGQYALMPVAMKVGSVDTVGTLSLDTMVHPDYRRQGMFTKLARQAYEDLAQHGVALTYGFPNHNSYHGFVTKLGWSDLHPRIPLFAKVLRYRSTLRKKLDSAPVAYALAAAARMVSSLELLIPHRGLPSGCAVHDVSRFGPEFDDLWDRARGRYRVWVVRDARYLNWRYVDNPSATYERIAVYRGAEVLAYAILKSEERFGLKMGSVVDLVATEGDRALESYLLGEALRRFRDAGLDIASCMALEHTSVARALLRRGFIPVPAEVYPQELHLGATCHSTARVSEEPMILDPTSWFITWGDHDQV